MRKRTYATVCWTPSTLFVAAALSVTASDSGVAQIFEFPGAYSQRWDGVDAAKASESTAGRKPREIVVVGSKVKKQQGKTTGTDDWSTPDAAKKSAPGVRTKQFNPEQLSRGIQTQGGTSTAGSSTRPYIVGPLWNSRSRATKE